MRHHYALILLALTLLLSKSVSFGQASACPQVNAGTDVTICPGQCTNLTATVQGSVSTSSYTTQPIPYNPYSYTTGTQVLINIDDTWSPAINMPFCFQFFGNTYTQFVIGSNGVISFDVSLANGYCQWPIGNPIPSNANPMNSIMAPWHDVDPSVGASSDVRYQTYGVAPCRQMVISWYNVPMYSGSCNGNASLNATQQIVLHETTNIIDIYIQNKRVCGSWNGGYAIEGIQNATGTVAYAVPGRNYPTLWTATNDGYRFMPAGAPNYTIQWLDQLGNVVGNTNTINVCPVANTTYTAQVTNTTCAGPPIVVTDQVVVNVGSATPLVAGSNSPICQGAALNLTSTAGGVSYAWTGPNGFNSALQNPTIPGATTAASGTYTVVMTTAGGCTTSSTVSVTVSTPPTPAPGSNSPICAGATLNLTSGAGVGWSWTGPNGFNSNLQNPTLPGATTAASGTYTVVVTAAGGCTASGTVSVTVNPSPTAAPGSNSPICAGATLNLTSGAGTGWAWSGPNGFNSNLQNPTIPGATTAASGTYTVTVTAAGGCTSSSTVNVTVNPVPTATPGSNTPICAGATLNLTSGAGTGWAWLGPNGFNSNLQNPTIPGATTAASGTYTVTVTAAGGCTASGTTSVTVNPVPTPAPGSNSPICAGATLNLTSGAGIGWAWSGPNGFNSNLQNPTIPGATTAASGTYTVTVTAAGGCTSSSTVNVTVNPVPTATPGSNTPICAGATLNLTSGAGTGWAWLGPNGFNSNLQNPTIPGATTAASGTYTVTVTAAGGCTASGTTSVTVNPVPTPAPGSNSPICAGATLNLTSGAGTGWAWSGPNGFNSNLQNPTIPGATTAASGTYTVTVTAAGGCTSSSTVNVTVNPVPTATPGSNTPICAGATLNLTSGAGTGWTWSGPNGFNSNLQNPTIPGATTAASGTYTVTVTAAGGCTASGTTSVTVNPVPTPAPGSNSPICAGATLNLTSGAGTGWAWSGPNGFNSNLQNPTIPGATTAASGTYTVTVTAAGGCTSSSTVNVTVNPSPAATPGSNSPICAGATLNLTSGAGTGWTWSGPNGFNSNLQNPTIPGATTAASGIYTVTVTAAGGCTASGTVNVTVSALPVANPGSNSPICSGATLNLTSSAGAGWAWTGPNGFNSNVQNPTIPGATTAASGTYTVTVTAAGGCTASGTVNVTVNALPVPNPGNNGPICSGTTLNLTSGAGTGWSWSGPNGFNSNTQNPSIPGATTAASGSYTVTVTDANGCTASATTNAVVNALPNAVANSNSPICQGGTINLSSNGGTAYAWTGPNAFNSNTQNPSIPNAAGVNAGTYTVQVTDANGCTQTATTVVVVNNPAVVAAGSNSPVCDGAALNFNGSAGWSTYTWTGPNGFNSNLQNPSISPISLAGAGTYTLDVVDANGCLGNATVNVVVNALPVPVVNNNGPVCDGTSIGLTANGGTGYAWIGPNGFNSNTQNPTINPVSMASAGTYTVTVTDGNSCTQTGTTQVVINALPVPVANNTGPVCDGSAVNLGANGGTGYAWTGPNGFNNNTQNPVINPVSAADGGTYTVTVTDVNGCTATATTVMVVNALPVPVANSNGPVCEFSALNLSANGGTGYAWSGPNGFNSAAQNPSIPGATVAASGTYTVTVTDANGCQSTTTVNAVVVPGPVVNFSADQLAGCMPLCVNFADLTAVNGGNITGWDWQANGQSFSNAQNPYNCFNTPGTYDITLNVSSSSGCVATLTIPGFITVYNDPVADFNMSSNLVTESDPIVTFTDASLGAGSWNWDFGDGTFSNAQNPVHSFSDTGNFCVTLTVTSPYGCVDDIKYCLYVQPEVFIYIPNTFTPNDDKINDGFLVYGRGLKDAIMLIFDRWGEPLARLDNDQPFTVGWDGRYNGEPVKQDVYTYKIYVTDVKGDKHEFIGHVNVVR